MVQRSADLTRCAVDDFLSLGNSRQNLIVSSPAEQIANFLMTLYTEQVFTLQRLHAG